MEAVRKPGMIHVKVMCLITHEGKILATKGQDDVKNELFYRLIGGGVHYCEDARDAVIREVREELGSELNNVRFLDVIQNIFTYQGKPGHEIIFLYAGELERTDLYDQTEIPIADHPATKAMWISIESVLAGQVRLYPAADYSKYLG